MKNHENHSGFRDVILYLFFGVCTTAVNVAVYCIMEKLFGAGVMSGTIAAWFAAVGFAYVTNRKWVFHSKAETAAEICREAVSFFACRLATGIVDWGCMYIFADRLRLNDVLIKILANVLVIVMNYVASKLLIFKRKDIE